MPLTHYEILGLTPTGAPEEIRRAYRRQALHWHPDRNPNNPKAHRRFIAIKDAYAVVSNPERRAYYDAVLRQREQAKYNPPPFQQTYSPPSSHQTPYTPQYRPVFRERPRSRGWTGVGAGVFIFMLFRLVSMCNQRTYEADNAGLHLEGLRMQNGSLHIDSVIYTGGRGGWDTVQNSADCVRYYPSATIPISGSTED